LAGEEVLQAERHDAAVLQRDQVRLVPRVGVGAPRVDVGGGQQAQVGAGRAGQLEAILAPPGPAQAAFLQQPHALGGEVLLRRQRQLLEPGVDRCLAVEPRQHRRRRHAAELERPARRRREPRRGQAQRLAAREAQRADQGAALVGPVVVAFRGEHRGHGAGTLALGLAPVREVGQLGRPPGVVAGGRRRQRQPQQRAVAERAPAVEHLVAAGRGGARRAGGRGGARGGGAGGGAGGGGGGGGGGAGAAGGGAGGRGRGRGGPAARRGRPAPPGPAGGAGPPGGRAARGGRGG